MERGAKSAGVGLNDRMFCVTRRVTEFTYVYFWVGAKLMLNQSPYSNENALTRGVSTCGIIGRCQQKCFEFFSTRKHSAMTKVGTS